MAYFLGWEKWGNGRGGKGCGRKDVGRVLDLGLDKGVGRYG